MPGTVLKVFRERDQIRRSIAFREVILEIHPDVAEELLTKRRVPFDVRVMVLEEQLDQIQA